MEKNVLLEKKAFLRDSGYESVAYKPSILDKLLHTHSVWLQLSLADESVGDLLQDQPPAVRTTHLDLMKNV